MKNTLSKSFQIVRKVKKIFSACNHNFALTEDKKVFAWGDNSLSVLGVQGKTIRLPKEVIFKTSNFAGKRLVILESEENRLESIFPVSYTHLTLPTILRV